jgi:hypothetical protein
MLIKQDKLTYDLQAYIINTATTQTMEISCDGLYCETAEIKRPDQRQEI